MLYSVALLALAAVASATDFSGSGQIRALDSDDLTSDLGCLTDAGAWTKDETLCGTFTATRSGSSATVVSAEGPCTISSTTAIGCASGNSAFTYAILSDDGVDILSKGDSFTFATTGDPSTAPATIQVYGASSAHPWIHLGWTAL